VIILSAIDLLGPTIQYPVDPSRPCDIYISISSYKDDVFMPNNKDIVIANVTANANISPFTSTGAAAAGVSFLNGVIRTSRSIPVGGIVALDETTGAGSDIDYNASTGMFTVNTPGLYLFSWNFSVTPQQGVTIVQIRLELSPQEQAVAGVAIQSSDTVPNGSTALVYTPVPQQYAFINRSGGLIFINGLGPDFAVGNVAVVRLA